MHIVQKVDKQIFFTESSTSSAVEELTFSHISSLPEINLSITAGPEEGLPEHPSRRRRISTNQYLTASDELCFCACNRRYDSTSMSRCKGVVGCTGVECHNRIRRACVPLDWLCNSCRTK